jgi:hypothetical protein
MVYIADYIYWINPGFLSRDCYKMTDINAMNPLLRQWRLYNHIIRNATLYNIL